jgi:hypothetical protein
MLGGGYQMSGVKVCSLCEDELSDYELQSPESDEDGNLLCDICYKENYQTDCYRCEESFLESESSNEGCLIVIRDCVGDFLPGYYRILGLPFFWSEVVGGGGFFESKLEFVSVLDREYSDDFCISGPVCLECQKQIEERT